MTTTNDDVRPAVQSDHRMRAEALLTSLKGVERARVDVNAHGRVEKVWIESSLEERAAARNAQSALMAVFGSTIDVNIIVVGEFESEAPVVVNDPHVIELKPARRDDLNDAAKVAFETLRTAQASFNGFAFDGAELVRIGGHQYVVVAIKRASTEARYCGAAPVIDGVGSASARALMNAVGVAAIGVSPADLRVRAEYEELEA